MYSSSLCTSCTLGTLFNCLFNFNLPHLNQDLFPGFASNILIAYHRASRPFYICTYNITFCIYNTSLHMGYPASSACKQILKDESICLMCKHLILISVKSCFYLHLYMQWNRKFKAFRYTRSG